MTDLGKFGTNATPKVTTKSREIEVEDVEHQGRIQHEQALGAIFTRSDALRPTEADKPQQIDLRLPLQVFTTDSRVVTTRKSKRSCRIWMSRTWTKEANVSVGEPLSRRSPDLTN